MDNEIARQAVQRARMCEAIGGRDAGMLFLIGLFSLLDSMFRMPLSDILERINLAPEAREALLDRTGPFGDALNFVEAYELGLWEQTAELGKQLGVPAGSYLRRSTRTPCSGRPSSWRLTRRRRRSIGNRESGMRESGIAAINQTR